MPVHAGLKALRPTRVLMVNGGGSSATVSDRVIAHYRRTEPDVEYRIITVDPYSPAEAFATLRGEPDLDSWMEGSDLLFGPGTAPLNVAVAETWLSRSGGSGTQWWPEGRNSVLIADTIGTQPIPFPSLSIDDLAALNGVGLEGFDWSISSGDPRLGDEEWLRTVSDLLGSAMHAQAIDRHLQSRMSAFEQAGDGFPIVRAQWTMGDILETLVCIYVARLAAFIQTRHEITVHRGVKIHPKREFDVVALVGPRAVVLSCTNTRRWDVGVINKKYREIDSRTEGPILLTGREGRFAVAANIADREDSLNRNMADRRAALTGRRQPARTDLRTLFLITDLLPQQHRAMSRKQWVDSLSNALMSPVPPTRAGKRSTYDWLVSAIS